MTISNRLWSSSMIPNNTKMLQNRPRAYWKPAGQWSRIEKAAPRAQTTRVALKVIHETVRGQHFTPWSAMGDWRGARFAWTWRTRKITPEKNHGALEEQAKIIAFGEDADLKWFMINPWELEWDTTRQKEFWKKNWKRVAVSLKKKSMDVLMCTRYKTVHVWNGSKCCSARVSRARNWSSVRFKLVDLSRCSKDWTINPLKIVKQNVQETWHRQKCELNIAKTLTVNIDFDGNYKDHVNHNQELSW